MSQYDLFGGACRTAGGNKGSYDERWELTHAQTSAAKGAERAADCVAFELMMVGSFDAQGPDNESDASRGRLLLRQGAFARPWCRS